MDESIIADFQEKTKDVKRVQKETLQRILEKNSNAEYLRNIIGLGGRTDEESFKAKVPVVNRRDLEPYIQRIADGETNILTEIPITALSLSSGTTEGKAKYIPYNEELLKTTIHTFRLSFAFRNREFPIKKGKALKFIFSSKQHKTKGGLTANVGTTSLYSSQEFKNAMSGMQSECCSPDEVIFCPNMNQSLYCHFLFGLIYWDEIQFINSTFAHTIVHAFRAFEYFWRELCTDIRDGVVSNRVTLQPIRSSVSKVLKPNPELADLIYKKCSGLKDWHGVIPELWPSAKYVYAIMTGSMEPYMNKLRHYAGNLPLISADYGASEGWVGANVHPRSPPESVTYAVLPDIGYYEFIPLEEKVRDLALDKNISSESKPVGLTEVKIGEEYEVVITNFAGLYRYCLGDIVQVMGFYNSTPELQFVRRKNVLLKINTDKTTEKDLQLAVEAASKLLEHEHVEIVDYTSHADVSTEPGHYVIFWELNDETGDDVLSSCCNYLDESFIDISYVRSRELKAIGALELRIVRRNTFEKILHHYVGQGSAVSQFKTPRCVNASNGKVLEILCSNVVRSYFSTAFG